MSHWPITIICLLFMWAIYYVLRKYTNKGFGVGAMVGNTLVAMMVMVLVLLCTLVCLVVNHFLR